MVTLHHDEVLERKVCFVLTTKKFYQKKHHEEFLEFVLVLREAVLVLAIVIEEATIRARARKKQGDSFVETPV